jgi:hypothetical protein
MEIPPSPAPGEQPKVLTSKEHNAEARRVREEKCKDRTQEFINSTRLTAEDFMIRINKIPGSA